MEFLVIVVLIGLLPASIARSKGRSFVAWWIYGAAIFIIALPHSLIIKKDVEKIEKREIADGNSKKCPFCAELIKKEAIKCRYCGSELSDEEKMAEKIFVDPTIESIKEKYGNDAITIPSKSDIDWTCICGTTNPLKNKKIQNCSSCHRNRDYVLQAIARTVSNDITEY